MTFFSSPPEPEVDFPFPVAVLGFEPGFEGGGARWLAVLAPGRDANDAEPFLPAGCDRAPFFNCLASSALSSFRSFMVSAFSVVLCWIFPNDSRTAAFAFALAMISANDPFFVAAGFGAASPVAEPFTAGRDGIDLALLVTDGRAAGLDDAVVGVRETEAAGLVDEFGAFVDGLLVVVMLEGLSVGRDIGFDEVPFGLEDPFAADSARGVFVVGPRSSSSALRLGAAVLGRERVVGEVAGFSPVIDASKSLIWHIELASRHVEAKNLAYACELTGIVTTLQSKPEYSR